MAGVKMVHIPYKGMRRADRSRRWPCGLVFNGLTSAMPLIKSGKLRALAVTSITRTGSLPDMPRSTNWAQGLSGGGVERPQRAGAHAKGHHRQESTRTS